MNDNPTTQKIVSFLDGADTLHEVIRLKVNWSLNQL